MKLLTLLFLFSFAAQASTIAVKFDYNFAGLTACSTSVTKDCLEKFEVGTLTNDVFTSAVSIPLPANPTGQVSGIGGSFTTNAFGQITLSAIAVAKDNNGNRITSDPALSTVTTEPLKPGAPTGLTVTVTVNVSIN